MQMKVRIIWERMKDERKKRILEMLWFKEKKEIFIW